MPLTSTREERAEQLATTIRDSGPYRWAGLYDVTTCEVILLGASDGAVPAYPRFSRNAGLTASAIATLEPVLSSDVASDARYLTAFDSTGSELIVPIKDERHRVVGTLDVESMKVDAFGPSDVERLCAVAASLTPLFTECTVRAAQTSDATAFAEIYAPSVEQEVASFEEVSPTSVEMAERIRTSMRLTPWLAALNGAQVVGFAYATKHRDRAAYRWSVDTSVYVNERFHGRGAGSKLYTDLFRILERQGFRRAFCGIALPNDASVAMHRAAGFEPIGIYKRVGWKRGVWHDTAWFGRDIGEDDTKAPAEPTPFAALVPQADL